MSKIDRLLARLFRPAEPPPVMPRMHPYNFLLQLQPLLLHGRRTVADEPPGHALTEVALTAYLMGMGFDYKTARAIVDTWESDESMMNDGILE